MSTPPGPFPPRSPFLPGSPFAPVTAPPGAPLRTLGAGLAPLPVSLLTALSSAGGAVAGARTALTRAHPRAWAGSAAAQYEHQRARDLELLEQLIGFVAGARQALANHRAARFALAAALAGAGAAPGLGPLGASGWSSGWGGSTSLGRARGPR